MPAEVTVIYPNKPDAKFDMNYYMSKHMPLVAEKWGPLGLKSWRIMEYSSTMSGEQPPYLVEAKLHWNSVDDFKKACDQEGPTVFGDVPNYTNIDAMVLFGDHKGSG